MESNPPSLGSGDFSLTSRYVCDTLELTKWLIQEVVQMGFSEVMRALSDGTRREILGLLRERPMSATELVSHFPMSAPAVSKHLSILKDAELVRCRREGKFMVYELSASE